MDKREFLEIQAIANPSVKTGFLSSTVIPLEAIANAFIEATRGTPLQPFATAKPAKLSGWDGFRVTLHPNAMPVEILADRITLRVSIIRFSAITSLTGPGYHAFVIACMDAVQAKLGLKWDYVGTSDDQTGYARTRDFSGLQHEMARFFRNRCRQVVEGRIRPRVAGTPAAYLGIPIGAAWEGDGNEILTNFGPRSFEEVEQWSALEGDSLAAAAADFFPWWGQGFEGTFYRGVALELMWRRMRWAKLFERSEGTLIANVLNCLSEAMRHGHRLPVSLSVISEILTLVGPEAPEFPHSKGIGYRRRNVPITMNGWSVSVPGSLVLESTEPGGCAVGNGAFRVQVSDGILSPGADHGGEALAPGEVARDRGFYPADDGKGFVLDAVVRTPSLRGPEHLCLVKIWMADEKWRNLAEAIVDSVTLTKT
ncbi:hypothetical protein [Dongia sp.]|uniref:hypothetical protein n=1 Tax=Dongia sp. TaxID=1977262 RepID=UPI0037511C98